MVDNARGPCDDRGYAEIRDSIKYACAASDTLLCGVYNFDFDVEAFSVQTQFAFSRRFLLEIPDSGSVSPFNCILWCLLRLFTALARPGRESWAAQ